MTFPEVGDLEKRHSNDPSDVGLSVISHHFSWKLGALVIGVFFVSIFAAASTAYEGSWTVLGAFFAACYAMVAVTWLRRPTFFSRFVSIFLFLGFAAKLVSNRVLGIQLIEPTGVFDYSPGAFDIVLIYAAVGFVGVMLGHLLSAGSAKRLAVGPLVVPAGCAAIRGFFYTCIAAVILLAVANYYFGFIRIGVLPQIQLPSIVQMGLTFMVLWGGMIALAAVWGWLFNARAFDPSSTIVLAAAIGFLISLSIGGRAQIILYVMAALLAVPVLHLGFRRPVLVPKYLQSFVAVCFLVVASLGLVMVDRAFNYARQVVPVETTAPAPFVEMAQGPGHTPLANPPPGEAAVDTPPPPSASTPGQVLATDEVRQSQPAALPPASGAPATDTPESALPELTVPVPPVEQEAAALEASPEYMDVVWTRLSYMPGELSRLVVMRWLGLEGVMAVSSDPTTGAALFQEALAEREQGTDALYQRIAQTQYEQSDRFSFQTMAGAIAFLAYSGTYWVVLVGMAILVVANNLVERMATRLLSNAFLSSLVGCSLAYYVVQLTYPRSIVAFIVQILVAVFALYIAQRLLVRVGALRMQAADGSGHR